jgi:hypothetical protein
MGQARRGATGAMAGWCRPGRPGRPPDGRVAAPRAGRRGARAWARPWPAPRGVTRAPDSGRAAWSAASALSWAATSRRTRRRPACAMSPNRRATRAADRRDRRGTGAPLGNGWRERVAHIRENCLFFKTTHVYRAAHASPTGRPFTFLTELLRFRAGWRRDIPPMVVLPFREPGPAHRRARAATNPGRPVRGAATTRPPPYPSRSTMRQDPRGAPPDRTAGASVRWCISCSRIYVFPSKTADRRAPPGRIRRRRGWRPRRVAATAGAPSARGMRPRAAPRLTVPPTVPSGGA